MKRETRTWDCGVPAMSRGSTVKILHDCSRGGWGWWFGGRRCSRAASLSGDSPTSSNRRRRGQFNCRVIDAVLGTADQSLRVVTSCSKITAATGVLVFLGVLGGSDSTGMAAAQRRPVGPLCSLWQPPTRAEATPPLACAPDDDLVDAAPLRQATHGTLSPTNLRLG